jgi:hypothetical protein
MTREEAQACCARIRETLDSARALIYDLWSRKGWRALGYVSWSQCVANEFCVGRSQVYRELKAAQIEIGLSSPSHIGLIPERALRELNRLADPVARAQAWDIACGAWEGQAGDETPVPVAWVKAAVSVMEVVSATGGYVALGGDMLPATQALMQRAVVEEADEARKRQQQYVRDRNGTLLLCATFTDIEEACAALREAARSAACFKLLVYEQVEEGH